MKLSFRIGHPPAIHQIQCICVGEGSGVSNLQTEFNYPDLFKSYGIFSDLLSPEPRIVSASSPCRLRRQRGPRSPRVIPGDDVVPIVPIVSLGWVTEFQPVLHLETRARRPRHLRVVSGSRASPPAGLLVSYVVPTTYNHFKSIRNLTPINPPMHPTTHTHTNTLDYVCKWYMLKWNWIISMWWIFYFIFSNLT